MVTVIVDDNMGSDVWDPRDRPNLLPVPPWRGDPGDRHLDSTLVMLQRMHEEFFCRLGAMQAALQKVSETAECVEDEYLNC